MERVVVTVKRIGEADFRDLEFWEDTLASQLAEAVTEAFGWDKGTDGHPIIYDIEAHPPGRKLKPDESLKDAQVHDGAWLIFHPQNERPTLQAQHSTAYVFERVS